MVLSCEELQLQTWKDVKEKINPRMPVKSTKKKQIGTGRVLVEDGIGMDNVNYSMGKTSGGSKTRILHWQIFTGNGKEVYLVPIIEALYCSQQKIFTLVHFILCLKLP